MPPVPQSLSELEQHRRLLQMRAAGKLITLRSTLTPRVAADFYPFLERVVLTGNSVKILFSDFAPKNKPATVYRKLLDAMVWIVVHDSRHECPVVKDPSLYPKFAQLRAEWYIEVVEDGLIIHPKKMAIQIQRALSQQRTVLEIAQDTITQAAEQACDLRKSLMDYVQNAPSGDAPFVHQGPLSAEDKAFVKQLCTQADIGYSFESDGRLIVVK